MSAAVKRFSSPLCRCIRVYVELDDKWKAFKHLKGARGPQGSANIFVLIFFFSVFFFFEGKQFSVLFISVNNNNSNKRHRLQIYLSALLTTKDKNAAFAQAVLSVQRGLCSWCCSTSNGKYVFQATNMCVVCCGTKIAGSCCTLVSHSFLHLVY